MDKIAQTNHVIHDLLKSRWSPRAFSDQPVEFEKLLSIFEAARWAPSAANMQPWAFIVTTQQSPEPFAKLLDVLFEKNRLWAQHAPVLVLAVAQSEREPGKPNTWAGYDLGQAVAHISVQASALGLYVHQMAGFDHEKTTRVFELPTGYEPITVFTVGYPGDPAALPDDLRDRELAVRTRKPLSEIAFDGAWQRPLDEKISNLD